MAKQTLNIGTVPNDGSGDKLRDAFDKVNDNFDEIYSAFTFSSNNAEVANSIILSGDANSNGIINNSSFYLYSPSANLVLTATSFSLNNVHANSTTIYVGNTLANSTTLKSDVVITTNITANGSTGSADQVLTANGTGIYWNDLGSISTDETAQYTWTNTHSFTNTITITAISSNGTVGEAGQVLSSNGTTTYWNDVAVGTVTDITAGNGLTGGTISGSGTIDILANNGITANSTGAFVKAGTGAVVNSTGVHVNATYISTLSANNATYLNTKAEGALSVNNAAYLGGSVAAAYLQNTDSKTLSGNLYFTGANTYVSGKFTVANNITANIIPTFGDTSRPLSNAISDVYNVKNYGAVGNGTASDYTSIQNAISNAASAGVYGVYIPPGTYSIGAPLTITSNIHIFGEGTLYANSTFAGNTMLNVTGNNVLISGIILDGTGMDAPTGTYTSGSYPGCAITSLGNSTVHHSNLTISHCRFNNLQAAALHTEYTDDLIVDSCKATNVQNYSSSATVGVFAAYSCENVKYINSTIDTYNWKGFYGANANNVLYIDCDAFGGSSGHASHYFNSVVDGKIIGGYQTGGFGIKTTDCIGILISNFTSYESSGGIYIYATENFQVTDCKVLDITTNTSCMFVEAENVTYTRDTKNGIIKGNILSYASVKASASCRGIYLSPRSSQKLKNIIIRDNVIQNAFYGIQCVVLSDGDADDIVFENNRILNSNQYSMLLYGTNFTVKDNYFDKHANSTQSHLAMATNTNYPGKHFIIDGNVFKSANSGTRHAEVFGNPGNLQLDSLVFTNNKAYGGNTFFIVSSNTSTAHYIDMIDIKNNIGHDQTYGNVMILTLNSTNNVHTLFVTGNMLADTSGTLKSINVTNNATNKLANTAYNIVSAINTV